MSDPFIGEISIFGFDWAPKGYALCQGQQMQVSTNQALFALLGVRFGGNQTLFNLPDLRGRTPLGQGALNNVAFSVGQTGGTETVTLSQNNMPAHSHQVIGSDQAQNTASPAGAYFATATNRQMYTTALDNSSNMAAGMIEATGGGAPKENRQPYLAINYVIATVGLWPSRP